jgi:hydroxymethylbilane synthase
VDDARSRAAVRAEREVLRRLGAGCRLPLGAWARVDEERLVLLGALALDDGSVRTAEAAAPLDADPRALGDDVAARLQA